VGKPLEKSPFGGIRRKLRDNNNNNNNNNNTMDFRGNI
jgi:hypothetical protein